MQCGVCGDSTHQLDGERRDLGDDGESFVCSGCLDVADRAIAGIGGSPESGSDPETGGDSGGVSTKYDVDV